MNDTKGSDPHPSSVAGLPHRRGVVAVVVRGERLLVIRRSAHVVAPGMFCFPGGGIVDGETEEQALVREIDEELAVAIRPIRRVWRSITPWQVELAWWLGELAAESALAPNPAEVESVGWYTPKEMLALDALLQSNRDFLAALSAGEIDLRRRKDEG